MNRHKHFNLIIIVVLLIGITVIPGRSATSHGTGINEGASKFEAFQDVPGFSSEWWGAVQERMNLTGNEVPWYKAGITGLPHIPNWMDEGEQPEARFGYSVGMAGDVNGDGYDDVIVGAHLYDHGQTDEGAAAVYYGSATGLSPIPNWLGESNQEGAEFGYSVGSAGDVNNDGYDDIIIGVHYYDNDQNNEGAAVVYHGSASGLSLIPNWLEEGDNTDAHLGVSVGSAGDVNGDDYDDVIIGAPAYTNGQYTEGKAEVFFGSAIGLSYSPNWEIESNQLGANFGKSVASAGDVNGDGYADIIVGAPYYDHDQTDEGAAAVYHGSSSGLSLVANWFGESNQAFAEYSHPVGKAGDVNNDGYDDIIIGTHNYNNGQVSEGIAVVYLGSASGLSLTPNWFSEGNQENAHYGVAAGTAGDVNNDGYADVIVGAPYIDRGQYDEGEAVVYLGTATGLSLIPDWVGESNLPNAWFGWAASTAGDVNDDGYSDIIVGVSKYTNGQSEEGAAAVYHGSRYYHVFLPLSLSSP